MKYKRVFLAAIAVICLLPLVTAQQDLPRQRHYQHLEALPKEPCTDHGEEVFCTHLPLINLVTDAPLPDGYIRDEQGNIKSLPNGRHIFNNETVTGTLELFDSPTRNNHLTDTPVLRERLETRYRGNSSRRFDKKSYLLKFKKDNLIDKKNVSLCGMTPDSSWVLHGPFMDRTLMRNYLCYHLAGEIMEYSPDVRFCELFVNGEYMGVYLITERINFNSKGRIKLTPTDPEMGKTSYILKMDHAETDPMHQLSTFCDFSGKRGLDSRVREKLEIIYPSRTLTQDQKWNILYEISTFEKALTSYDSGDPRKGYPAYIDVDSFVNFLILNEFTLNADAGTLSTYFCKDIRGKLKIICWDFNNVFNNYYKDLTKPQTFYINNTLFNMLLRDQDFVEQVIARYRHLRKTVLSDEYLFNFIDETAAYLGPAIDRNYEKWGYCFTADFSHITDYQEQSDKMSELGLRQPQERNPQNYEEAIAEMKAEIHARGVFLDQNIEALRAYSHESATKQFKLQGGH